MYNCCMNADGSWCIRCYSTKRDISKALGTHGNNKNIIDLMTFIIAVGIIEIALGIVVLIRPFYSLLAFIFA